MKQISNIIGSERILSKKVGMTQKTNFRDRRPVINLSFNTFKSALAANANKILKRRNLSSTFQFLENHKSIIEQLYLYATCDECYEYDLNSGLCFVGSYGTGETLLMEAFLEIFNQDIDSKNIRICNSTDLFREISKDVEIIKSLNRRPLFIDDLGKEEPECKVFGSTIKPISDLLATRYNNGAINFFTSNYKLSSLEKFYGKYIADRLKETVTFIEMIGDSLREESRIKPHH